VKKKAKLEFGAQISTATLKKITIFANIPFLI
jgi:hypothetical protein